MLTFRHTINLCNQVKIWNRLDCCSERLTGANVYVVSDGGKSLCGPLPQMHRKKTWEISCSGKTGKKVTIQIARKTYLMLCEGEVWGTIEDRAGNF